MMDIQKLISSFSPSQQRETLFYLVRYFKQAKHLEENGKNFFDDVLFAAPDSEVRRIVPIAIKGIESDLGRTAAKLDDDQVEKTLLQLTGISRTLTLETFSSKEIENAKLFLKR